MNITCGITSGIKMGIVDIIGQAGDYLGLICFVFGLVIMVVTVLLSPKVMKKEEERQKEDIENPTKTYTDEKRF